MRCRLPCWLYHIQCNRALWTGPQAPSAYYSYTLDFKAGIKMEGWWWWWWWITGLREAVWRVYVCVCMHAFGVGDALV